jgi:heme oxygenase (biliverdin-IX-beta and delta-forming)
MLKDTIKEATRDAHQQLEVIVVKRLKAIRSNADYADVLKHFFSYFSEVEKAIAPYITTDVLPDHAARRNSSYLKQDIEALGGSVDVLPKAQAPAISSVAEALGALYVMEGSIMGGRIIVQMLEKYGVTTGVSFFSGYGAETGKMWQAFTDVMNKEVASADHQLAIDSANKTFTNFGKVFTSAVAASSVY